MELGRPRPCLTDLPAEGASVSGMPGPGAMLIWVLEDLDSVSGII